LTAIAFPTTNHLHRCLAATEIQKVPSFSMTGATSLGEPVQNVVAGKRAGFLCLEGYRATRSMSAVRM
jgi:hypothetical protein